MPLKWLRNHPLKNYSTFGIGGIARYFTIVTTVEELQEALLYCKNKSLSFHPLGKGSNSLFDDRGFSGAVIYNQINFLEINPPSIEVGGGYSFSILGAKTAKLGLEGLEFASGIPASVGGAVYMNAGANGVEVADCLTSVVFVNNRGEVEIYQREELDFSYRSSSFHNKPGMIASAKFTLKSNEAARKRQLKIIEKRVETQPLKEKSCGCVFRNPEGHKAGQLIDECGLKGLQIGGAMVSDVHANFIVNKSDATKEDVKALIREIKRCVKEKRGVDLELELREIPFE